MLGCGFEPHSSHVRALHSQLQYEFHNSLSGFTKSDLYINAHDPASGDTELEETTTILHFIPKDKPIQKVAVPKCTYNYLTPKSTYLV